MRSTHRNLASIATVAMMVLVGCGGTDDAGDTVPTADSAPATAPATTPDTTPDTTTAPAPETTAPADTTPEPAPDTTIEAAPDTAPDTAPATEPGTPDGAVPAVLSEWAIDAPTEYSAGEITFEVTNGGSFPHEFVVIQGEGYESLPLEEGGKIIEDELATGALIDRTARISSLESAVLTVELAPGNYVLVCNLGGGANSHAGAGQRLDISVT